MNTKIYAGKEEWDLGVPVVSFKDANGLNFAKSAKGWRKRTPTDPKILWFVYHYSVSYRAVPTFNSMNSINVSTHFLIDDDVNSEGVATIYQTLDMNEIAFTQGSHINGVSMNPTGVSVEVCYKPEYFQDKNLYSPTNVKKHGCTDDHPVVKGQVHGSTLSVHTPSEAQYKAMAILGWGVLNIFKDIKPEFPKDAKGGYLTTALSDPFKWNGLVDHRQLTKRKIDMIGLDFDRLQKDIVEMRSVGYNTFRNIK